MDLQDRGLKADACTADELGLTQSSSQVTIGNLAPSLTLSGELQRGHKHHWPIVFILIPHNWSQLIAVGSGK